MTHGLPSAGWYQSSYCDNVNDRCLQVARGVRGVQVRDSKDTDLPSIQIAADDWTAFLDSLSTLFSR
ncbi:DUF397 domain-containing protein [Streptomyces marianii]|uniref:DUF397 domain-containing protein n=1 Tax=Streptomyces marianii TaxID=1817406 RepID=A0A5R9DSF5_9ACTN|nr:DUF397 domain-containing protein [Streptomyces marianii]TLQ38944.1 DUF397 domain-containing protein [Streptomyces marianii]